MRPLPPPTPPEPPLRPRRLVAGSRVALVAPAGPLGPGRVEEAEARCRALGLEPRTGPHAYRRSGYLAGTDDERLADVQAALDDPEIDAIWALRGGYGTLRIVDRLRLDRLRRDPIAFLGFSDNTAIHARLTALGVISFHAPHPTAGGPSSSDDWFRRLTAVAEAPGVLPVPRRSPAPTPLTPGTAEGRLVGGNLALVAALAGSRDAVSCHHRILLLEDVGEPAYRIDRMLLQLERSGATEGVRGLAFGTFTEVPGATENPAEAGARVRAVLRSYAERWGVPALAGLPIGHGPDNVAVPLGARVRLDADRGRLEVIEPAVY